MVERDETKQHFYRVLELGGILGRAVRDYAGDLGAHQSIEPKDNLLDLWQLSVKSYLLMIEDGPPEVLELSALMKEMDAAVQTLSRSIEGQADMP